MSNHVTLDFQDGPRGRTLFQSIAKDNDRPIPRVGEYIDHPDFATQFLVTNVTYYYDKGADGGQWLSVIQIVVRSRQYRTVG